MAFLCIPHVDINVISNWTITTSRKGIFFFCIPPVLCLHVLSFRYICWVPVTVTGAWALFCLPTLTWCLRVQGRYLKYLKTVVASKAASQSQPEADPRAGVESLCPRADRHPIVAESCWHGGSGKEVKVLLMGDHHPRTAAVYQLVQIYFNTLRSGKACPVQTSWLSGLFLTYFG